MSLKLQSLLCAIAAGFMLAASPAGATTVTTTSYATWKSNLTGAPTADDNFPTTSCASCSTSAGFSLGGYTFTGPNGLGGFSLSESSYGSAGFISSSNAGAGINVAAPGVGTNAFLLSVGTTNSTPITLALSDGESFSLSSGLFGIALSHDVTSFTLSTSGGSQVYINDFYLGASSLPQDGGGNPVNPPANPTPTPEGSSIALLTGGLLVLFGSKKKWTSGFAL